MRTYTKAELEALEARLRPGAESASGFLAPGQRLEDVLARDRRTLAALGATFDQLANGLELALGRAERRVDLARRGRRPEVAPPDVEAPPIPVEPTLSVRAWRFAGHQDCPFDDGEGRRCPTAPFSSAHYELRRNGLPPLAVPGLMPHLIRAHGFFEGDVPCRVEPEALLRVLALAPCGGGEVPWRSERVWVFLQSGPRLPWLRWGGPLWHWNAALMSLVAPGVARPWRWDGREVLASGVTARRAGDWCVVTAERPTALPGDARLDGCEIALPRSLSAGAFQLRRVERRYVPLEDEIVPSRPP